VSSRVGQPKLARRELRFDLGNEHPHALHCGQNSQHAEIVDEALAHHVHHAVFLAESVALRPPESLADHHGKCDRRLGGNEWRGARVFSSGAARVLPCAALQAVSL
jgi:hypothetical protein